MSFDPLHQKQLLSTDQEVQAVLISKNALVRAGIRHILDGTRFMVAGEYEDSSPLIASPALYILDDSHGADALAEMVTDLKAQCPSACVVVLADYLDPATMMRALRAGMNGLFSTRMERNALITALELVVLGETLIPSGLVLTMLNGVSQSQESRLNTPPAFAPTSDTATKDHKLSGREVEILEHLMAGESNKLIARNLNIAEATIKVHLKTILRKLRATNRTQAAMWASVHLSAATGSRYIAQAAE